MLSFMATEGRSARLEAQVGMVQAVPGPVGWEVTGDLDGLARPGHAER
jgi:hypothetical protein